jgi:hypothetical protein
MLLDLQRLLVAALRTPDPAGFLRERAEREPGLRADERRALLAAGEDGLRMSRVMIRKLRLQRILRGDPDAAAAMARDPEAFAARFAAYDRDVAPTAVTPPDEAAQFRAY